jgi:hypothetical protein
MIDAEVVRLRNLRNMALRARALADNLDTVHDGADSVFAASAVNCWGLVRVISGYLKAHPYLSYQRGPSRSRDLFYGVLAAPIGSAARQKNRRHSVFAGCLQTLARELENTLVVTRSPHLSDALGRVQVRFRVLREELVAGAQREAGVEGVSRTDSLRTGSARAISHDAGSVDWPYLAI